jgi:hypothetical protein
MAVLLAAFAGAGCGVLNNLTGSSDSDGPVVRGHFLGDEFAGMRAQVRAASLAGGDIIVRILEDPAVSVKVASDGTFTLRGLPAGGFTLVFTQGGVEIGRQTFTEVQPNHEITLTLEVVDGEVVVIEERRTGIGHGDIEIEADIEKLLTITTSGDSKIQIDGKTVIIKPGETAIREGNTARSVTDLKVGMQVHIKGVWVEGSKTDVIATEIIIQNEDEEDAVGSTDGKATICHIPPGNPANKKTLEVGVSAVPAHMAHGDTMGPCSAGDSSRNKGPDGDKGNKGNPNKGGKKG